MSRKWDLNNRSLRAVTLASQLLDSTTSKRTVLRSPSTEMTLTFQTVEKTFRNSSLYFFPPFAKRTIQGYSIKKQNKNNNWLYIHFVHTHVYIYVCICICTYIYMYVCETTLFMLDYYKEIQVLN